MKLNLIYRRIGVLLALGAIALPAPARAEVTTPTVLIIATSADRMTNGKPTGLWLEELAVPHAAFTKAGFDVTIASPKGGAIPMDPRSVPTPDQQRAWRTTLDAMMYSVPLEKVALGKVDAVFVPGGHGAMFDLAQDARVAQIISEVWGRGKVVAAVCHGPAALVQAKGPDGKPLVAGRKVAAFTNEEEDAVNLTKDMPFLLETRLIELGATVEKAPKFEPKAVRDGNLVTGQNPPSSEKVAELTIAAIRENKARGDR
jgi:putative intracellular protease/amidase